jgi:hypothetical protein
MLKEILFNHFFNNNLKIPENVLLKKEFNLWKIQNIKYCSSCNILIKRDYKSNIYKCQLCEKYNYCYSCYDNYTYCCFNCNKSVCFICINKRRSRCKECNILNVIY